MKPKVKCSVLWAATETTVVPCLAVLIASELAKKITTYIIGINSVLRHTCIWSYARLIA